MTKKQNTSICILKEGVNTLTSHMEWELNYGATLHLTKDLLNVIDIHFILSCKIIVIDILSIHKFVPTLKFCCLLVASAMSQKKSLFVSY